jgi:hypothetical protein
MKTLVFIISIAVISCCSSGKINGKPEGAPVQQTSTSPSGLPACVEKMIGQFKSEEKQNPPRQVYSYLYNGKTVYYVTPPCCDFFSDLYDSDCNLIAHPDGGITGKGDGQAADFLQTRTNEKLIWKDDRK